MTYESKLRERLLLLNKDVPGKQICGDISPEDYTCVKEVGHSGDHIEQHLYFTWKPST